MTDSAQPSRTRVSSTDKRERLIAGARQTLYEQGVEKTTLADIATTAEVPVGNVYYYFKTKNEIIAAAITDQVEEVRATLAGFDRYKSPQTRLKAFVKMLSNQGEMTAEYGCPQGTLCSELDKRDDDLSRASAELMRIPIAWAEQQFTQMGRHDAKDLAVALIAAYQGIALLTNSFRDPALLQREAKRLERWIDTLTTT